MGFYLGLARFSVTNRTKWLIRAFTVPWFLHGLYDFLLMSGHPVLLIIFVPFLIFMYRHGLQKMNELNTESVFNPININFTNQQQNKNEQQESEM